MRDHLADVQVCLPGHGCVLYVPGAGQALNAAVAIGPQVLDGFFGAVLTALILVAVVAAARAVGTLMQPVQGVRPDGPLVIAALLLIVGGAVAAVPVLLPAAVPMAHLFMLSATSCVGAALLVLADLVARAGRVALTVAGILLLLSLPVSVLQFLLAAPIGPFSSDTVSVLGHLMLAVAGVALLVTGGGSGPLWWALLLPPVATLLAGLRLGLPFPVSGWIDLLPAVALVAAGLLVLHSRQGPARAVRDRRSIAAQLGGTAVALAVTLTVLLAWPASPPGARSAGEPAIGPVRRVTASTPLRFPLDRYRQSSADRDVVLLAENTLIRSCAADRAVAMQAADLLPPERSDSNFSLLGLIGEEQAETSGYWTPPPPESSSGAQSTRDLRVLTRCVNAARNRLGDDGRAQQLLSEAAFGALARTDADARVRRVQASWSHCMQLRGFVYATPTEVSLTQAVAFPTPGDTRTASASVICERATNLPGIRASVLAAYEQRTIAADGARLSAARSALVAQKQTAAAILRGRSPQQSHRDARSMTRDADATG